MQTSSGGIFTAMIKNRKIIAAAGIILLLIFAFILLIISRNLENHPSIKIFVTTNDQHVTEAPGLSLITGSTVTWRYKVTNTDSVPLSDVVVKDSATGVNPEYISGDINGNNLLDLNETWTFVAID